MTVKAITDTIFSMKRCFPIRQLDSLCKLLSITLTYLYGQIISKTAICIPANKSIQSGQGEKVNLLYHCCSIQVEMYIQN